MPQFLFFYKNTKLKLNLDGKQVGFKINEYDELVEVGVAEDRELEIQRYRKQLRKIREARDFDTRK